MRIWSKLAGGVAVIALAGGLWWAFTPDPVSVDMAEVTRGPMKVTVAAEGVTRVRDPYLVTAPSTGTTTRSPVSVGDTVLRGETVVAVIRPATPALLDARSRLQAEAAVTEAEAALRVAEFNLERAQADLEHAESTLARNRELAERGVIPRRTLEDAEAAARTARSALEAAQSQRDLQRATLARAQAQLVDPEMADPERAPGECCVEITAPTSGTVLDVDNMSARLVQAGAPLLTIGDLDALEIELDLLSTDAVRVRPGARALVDRWGGEGVLEATVRRVDPAAFTRVSALGIEEQRVRVILDFDGAADSRAGLGERFRVFVRVVVWEGDDVLQVPLSALFRHDGGWAVFRVEEDLARLTPVEIGQRHGERAQVLGGITAGAQVVAFPGDRVQDGTPVAPRPAG